MNVRYQAMLGGQYKNMEKVITLSEKKLLNLNFSNTSEL